ncbi:MAG: hypothetical protein ACXWP5_03850 [Bdellovibrionota bacterium]
MKSNGKSTLLGVALSVGMIGLSACDGSSIQSAAKGASKIMGVPVVVKTNNDDVCAYKQLMAIYADFEKLSKEDKKAFVQLAHNYKSIVINPSATLGHIAGEKTILRLYDEKGGLKAEKTVSDNLKNDGPEPATVLEKSEALSGTTQQSVDLSDRMIYAARDEQAYGAIKDAKSLDAVAASGGAKFESKVNDPLLWCGKLAGIRDLL